MALHYRGAGLSAAQLAELGKVLIDSADTTADFLSPKLLVTTNLVKTIQNIGGNENILLDVSLSGIETTLDGRYVLLAPASKNQIILPTTNNIPLIIKGFATGTSDILEIFDSTSPTQIKSWLWKSTGDLVLRVPTAPTNSKRLLIQTDDGTTTDVQFLWWDGSTSQVRIGDQTVAGGKPIILFQGDFKVDTPNASHIGSDEFWDRLIVTRGIHKVTGAWEFGDFSSTNITRLRTPSVIENTDLGQFTSFVLEQLTADPVSHVTGRLYDRTDLKQLSLDDGSAFHRLIDGSPSGVDQTIQPLTNQIPLTLKNSALGGFAQLVLSGVEASGADRRVRENAGALEITDSTPTILRSIITRGAPNVTVAHNAVSVAVSFSTSEPDTNYEITIVPAYNTTVWYTLKAITGFTANFGTAGPVGGSTFDWHIERIPRT